MFPDEFYKVPLWNCCRITDKSEIKDAFNVSPMWRLNFFTLINRQSERIGWLQFSLQHMKWLKRAYVSIGNDVPLFCITLQLIWMSWGFCVDTLLANCWEFWSLFCHIMAHVPWRFEISTDNPEQCHNISIHMVFLRKSMKILFGCACFILHRRHRRPKPKVFGYNIWINHFGNFFSQNHNNCQDFRDDNAIQFLQCWRFCASISWMN